MAPDLRAPSGGIKVIYNYVEHLVALGHDARVWHGTPDFSYPGWDSSAPVDTGVELDFAPGDLLVMPETGGTKWSFLSAGQPVVMLCQGMDFVFADTEFDQDVEGAYPGWPQAAATLAVSHGIAAFLERACEPGFPVHPVPVEIEPWFQPATKERRITLMPRRRRADLIGAVQLVRRSGALQRPDGDWQIVLIDGMTQQQVAAELGRSPIFLFGAEREGFGLPGAEAMAAGCYVVGFTGDGAGEYLTSHVAGVVPDSDVVSMAEQTIAAMDAFEADPTAFAARAHAGRTLVRERYNAENVRAALGTAFAGFTAPGFAGQITDHVRLPHYQAHAPRGGAAGAAYRGARRAARRIVDRATDRR